MTNALSSVNTEGIQPPVSDEMLDTTDEQDTATGDIGDENLNPENDQGQAEEQDEEKKEPEKERVFSQKELDEILTKRLGKQTKRAESEAAALRAEVESLKKNTPSNVTPSVEKESDLKPPKREDFELFEDYVLANAEYKAELKIEKRMRDFEGKQRQEAEKKQQEATERDFKRKADERVKAGVKEFADFNDVINDAAEEGIIVPGTELFLAIIESDVGHRVAYHLGKPENHAEAERLMELSPRALHREIGKLEAKLTETAKPVNKPRREPMETVEGRRHVNLADPMRENLSTAEFIEMRNKKEFGRERR